MVVGPAAAKRVHDKSDAVDAGEGLAESSSEVLSSHAIQEEVYPEVRVEEQ